MIQPPRSNGTYDAPGQICVIHKAMQGALDLMQDSFGPAIAMPNLIRGEGLPSHVSPLRSLSGKDKNGPA
jgi:hypothetical protein